MRIYSTAWSDKTFGRILWIKCFLQKKKKKINHSGRSFQVESCGFLIVRSAYNNDGKQVKHAKSAWICRYSKNSCNFSKICVKCITLCTSLPSLSLSSPLSLLSSSTTHFCWGNFFHVRQTHKNEAEIVSFLDDDVANVYPIKSRKKFAIFRFMKMLKSYIFKRMRKMGRRRWDYNAQRWNWHEEAVRVLAIARNMFIIADAWHVDWMLDGVRCLFLLFIHLGRQESIFFRLLLFLFRANRLWRRTIFSDRSIDRANNNKLMFVLKKIRTNK